MTMSTMRSPTAAYKINGRICKTMYRDKWPSTRKSYDSFYLPPEAFDNAEFGKA